MTRVFNFSAGPALLPEPVLRQAAEEMLDWHGSGMSVMEMSHRGKEFIAIHAQAEGLLRELLAIPANYKVLFLQGGAIAENAIVPMNLLRGHKGADYIHTGEWSKKSIQEAGKYCTVNVAASAAFYDAVLAPLGGQRVMDFGQVIGYGIAPKPDFWLGPQSTGEGFRESHIAFVALDNETFPLFRNTGKRGFVDATERSGMSRLSAPMAGYSPTIADFDNDGWKDIFVTRGHVQSLGYATHVQVEQPNTVFRNLGGLKFQALTEEAGLTAQPPSRQALQTQLELDVGHEHGQALVRFLHLAQLIYFVGRKKITLLRKRGQCQGTE